MATWGKAHRFERDQAELSGSQRDLFKLAISKFVEDLNDGRPPRAGLRVRGVEGCDGVYELTWDQNGRATFQYGDSIKPDHVHIIWRRVGDHRIFNDP